ncbi:MAG TPA: hypothetical protein VFK91_05845 [Methyloceanibacter sp.]|nr:hypothetical protein [Methyloceanibacter sp.]
MRFAGTAALGATLALLCASPAQALTISNSDPKPHKITVIAGGSSSEMTIDSEKQADVPCSDGCKVKLENGDEYELRGGETVSIDGGVMFIDHSPDADVKDIPDIDPDAPAPGAPAQ